VSPEPKRSRKEAIVYICLCNALTEAKVRDAASEGARRPGEIYAACGGRAQCGTCTSTILCLLRKLTAPVEAPPELLPAAE
jgi:bacterioferritin-associated ferredoxin